MPDHRDATLLTVGGRSALRFERTLSHPIERVWTLLTEPTQLAHWFPTPPSAVDLVVGGAIRFEDLPAEGVVTAVDPPRILAFTWGEDELRWELEPHADGCRLTLTHTFDDHFKAARDAAGWHLCLDGLESSLAGSPPPPGSLEGWPELNRAYEQRFGIAPEEATPPPS